MIQVRKSSDRGLTEIDWLKSFHSFSFDEYYEPEFMGFQSLRVINEDFVQPGKGFGMHGHRDMEIVTYVISGTLQHKDSMGNGSLIQPGEVQRMSAGTGVRHSEHNPSKSESVHLLQIWILPEKPGITPGYEQKMFPLAERRNQLRVLASQNGQEGSVTIHQDAAILGTVLEKGKTLTMALGQGRHAWIQLVKGTLTVNGKKLEEGDGAAISQETTLQLEANRDAEALIFDLA